MSHLKVIALVRLLFDHFQGKLIRVTNRYKTEGENSFKNLGIDGR